MGCGFPRVAHFKIADLPKNTSTTEGRVSVNMGGAGHANKTRNSHNIAKNEKDTQYTEE